MNDLPSSDLLTFRSSHSHHPLISAPLMLMVFVSTLIRQNINIRLDWDHERNTQSRQTTIYHHTPLHTHVLLRLVMPHILAIYARKFLPYDVEHKKSVSPNMSGAVTLVMYSM